MKKKHGLPPGIQLTNKGYLRVTKGPWKWSLVHRRIMEIALEETHPLTLAVLGIELDGRGKITSRGIPEKFDIHHVDGNKIHNCRQNLWLLDHVIHAKGFS